MTRPLQFYFSMFDRRLGLMDNLTSGYLVAAGTDHPFISMKKNWHSNSIMYYTKFARIPTLAPT